MPEGDTLHRTAATLQRALAGGVVTRFESVYPALTRVDEDQPLRGRTIESVAAVGKHLLIRLSGGLTLRSHLRMNGSWHVYRTGERWMRPARDMRIVIGTADFVAVGFRVPDAEFVAEGRRTRTRHFEKLGPDLLAPDFDAAEALARLRARGARTIETALLDQTALAGIGNVYKSEVLFACGVNPFLAVAALSDERIAALIAAARRLMAANVRPAAGETIVTYAGFRRTTGRGDPAEGLWVYGRGGRPCRRCGTPIEAKKSGPGVRVTYWCPRCQPDAAATASRRG